MVQGRKVRRASVCGSAAGRFAPATIRYALLSVLRSTFPAADRRPKPPGTHIQIGDRVLLPLSALP